LVCNEATTNHARNEDGRGSCRCGNGGKVSDIHFGHGHGDSILVERICRVSSGAKGHGGDDDAEHRGSAAGQPLGRADLHMIADSEVAAGLTQKGMPDFGGGKGNTGRGLSLQTISIIKF
jgi:hypothetical protein